MNPLKIVVVLWVGLIVIIFAFGIFGEGDVTITGNIPLTGILKEEAGQVFVSPEFNITFSMNDKDIYKIRDVEYMLTFLPTVDVKSVVDVAYIVTDSDGDIKFYDEESLTIQGETLIEGDLDRRKAQNIDLEEGEYTFSLRVGYGNKEKTFSKKFMLEEIPGWLYSLKQLFDIKMEIDQTILDSPEELEARIIFESFGSEPTPVDLTFFIYDMNDKEIFKKSREMVIETENVMFESFDEFDASPGEYMVVLRTLYNVDIEDYFEQKIVVNDKLDLIPFFVGGVIFLGGLVLVVYLSRKKR